MGGVFADNDHKQEMKNWPADRSVGNRSVVLVSDADSDCKYHDGYDRSVADTTSIAP